VNRPNNVRINQSAPAALPAPRLAGTQHPLPAHPDSHTNHGVSTPPGPYQNEPAQYGMHQAFTLHGGYTHTPYSPSIEGYSNGLGINMGSVLRSNKRILADHTGVARSPLLEDFRLNRMNKRFELKVRPGVSLASLAYPVIALFR
jgi:hypothetical protein